MYFPRVTSHHVYPLTSHVISAEVVSCQDFLDGLTPTPTYYLVHPLPEMHENGEISVGGHASRAPSGSANGQ